MGRDLPDSTDKSMAYLRSIAAAFGEEMKAGQEFHHCAAADENGIDGLGWVIKLVLSSYNNVQLGDKSLPEQKVPT